MKNLIIISVILLFSFLSVTKLLAQENNDFKNVNTAVDSLKIVVITLNDGGKIKGNILSMNIEEIIVKTDFAGIISLKRINIVSIVNYNENNEVTTAYNNKNPNNLDIMKFGGSASNYKKGNYLTYKANHKYFVNNSYWGLKKKELAYQNIWLLYNDWDYGINDNFSAGAGFVFLGNLTTLNLHIRTQMELKENLKIGAAYHVFFIPTNTSYASFGITSCGFTLGDINKNITFSFGQGNINSFDSKSDVSNSFNNFAYALSGSYKINESTSLITDNFYMEKSDMKFYSIGFRFHSKNSTFDLGYMGNSYLGEEYSYDGTGNYIIQKKLLYAAYPFLALTYKIR
ncbi:MAG: hypothetical protein ACOYMA_12210 [Bacteroidia bacterium]